MYFLGPVIALEKQTQSSAKYTRLRLFDDRGRQISVLDREMLRISDYDETTDTTLWVWYSATSSAVVLSRYAYSNVEPEQHLNTGPAANEGHRD